MSLPEKKRAPSPSLSQKSADIAIVNMILGSALWSVVEITLAIIIGSREKNLIPSAPDLGQAFEGFIFLTVIGIIVSLIPTLIGAKILSIWLQRNNVTQKSATITGAVIGALVISLLTIPITIFMETRINDISSSIIFSLSFFNLPIALCAALAGGRTGLQLAKFIETQNQNPTETEQDILTTTQL